MKQHDTQSSLDIVIVGAGIGGLTAALGLRQQGHKVTLLERSGLNQEVGAAIHLAPNCHGILKQFGIFPERFGANPVHGIAEYDSKGNTKVVADLRKPLSIWQHPWMLVHRVHLHEELKKLATSTSIEGVPAIIRTNCPVVDVNPIEGIVVLQDGSVVSGDLVIGADGVSSATRSIVAGPSLKPFGSGKSAFRFMLPRSVLESNPETQHLVAQEGYMTIWMGDDRRIVMYPCSNNTTMNFVGIHPSSLTSGIEKGWSRSASKDILLEVYSEFHSTVLAMLQAVDESDLKVWTLLDMDRIPTWTKGRLALLGDAAHPFLPHQGQGGAMAIEDAASLAAVLPLGTPAASVPERLGLYERIRDARAHKIQLLTRQSGEDLTETNRKTFDIMQFINYNFGHDEWHNSKRALQEHLWSINGPIRQRGPTSFGPMPSPRQDHYGGPPPAGGHTISHSIRFKTSATYLKTLFPTPAFSFASPGTFAEASLVAHEFRDLPWLGGRGYKVCGFWLHGVQYERKSGENLVGSFLIVMFESAADPIVTGREELGIPKIFCDIDIIQRSHAIEVKCSWDGTRFIEMDLGSENSTINKTEPNGLSAHHQAEGTAFWHRCVPSVGDRGLTDAEYLVGSAQEDHTQTGANVQAWPESHMRFNRGSWKSLPTLHHVASTLADMPIYGTIASETKEFQGVTNFAGVTRID